ncbi:MAG: caspase family protein [Lyngbya sp. HA4199-MV5]|jgi:WD40 repeat protein/energy-coupling factor transporter ATP-binding protein EcfA2|nr:caspase family protein [Lyngbya sp. HA4199-MV5]
MARYALIIGIAEYTTASFQSLESPVQNANAIADILDQYGEFNQVMRLPFRREAGQKDLGNVIRKPLTNETLVRELQKFLQDAAGSEVLLYYSGHGFSKVQPLSGTSEGYLAPSDCQVELNAAGQVIAEKNGISLADLNKLINHHKFSSLVVILDCCNSGAFLESDMVRRDFTFGYERDYYLITACRGSSKAYEGEHHSLLTAAVLKGLSPASVTSGSGWISGDRLFDVIGDELQNSRQEPLRMGWGRSITLVRYKQRQPVPTPESTFNPANPYMGLKAFEQYQADYFFGRGQAVRALLDRLDKNRFLSVIGPSGCGKSSLVKAGLLPELEGDRLPGSHDWQIKIITPGQYPLQVLTQTLEQLHSNDKPVVLFVDQFEELFTLCPNEEEQRTFIKRLNDETNNPTRQTRIIVAMRGDFLDRCAKFQESADLINSTAPTTYMVTPLTEAKLVAELEDSIICPAALHEVSFEPGLVSRIVNDVVNQPGAMPLLQYALMQLWDNCISTDGRSRLLTLQSYNAIDGVKGALQRWADQFYTSLSPTDQTFVRDLISELVQIGDAGEVTRRRANWERLRAIATSQEQLNRIIGSLIYQRLLVADDKTVEVAHEALLSESKLIQGWIDENRDDIRLQQRLEIYRHEWQDHDRSENYLLDAGRLAAIDEWMEKKQPRLMPVDQEFIEESRRRRDRQFQAQLEQERRLREEAEGRELAEIGEKIEAEARAEAEAERSNESVARVKAEKQKTRIATVAGALLVVLAAITTLSALSAQTEKRNAQAKEIKALIAYSEAVAGTNDQLKALIATVKVLKQLRERQHETPGELQRVITETQEVNRLEGHTREVNDASFSPDGKIIASGSFDDTIKIWNQDGKLLSSSNNPGKGVQGVTFSSDSRTIASVGLGETIRLWDTKGNLIKEINPRPLREDTAILNVKFSSDNKIIATGDWDKHVKLWRVADGKLLKSFQQSKRVYGVSFSPDGQMIASASADKTVRLWRVADGKLLKIFYHKDRVQDVSFSPDGQILASASWDTSVKLWRIFDGKELRTFQHKSKVYSISFSSNGQMLASGGEQGINVWKVMDGKLITKISGHSNSVNSVSFNRKNNLIISASDDKTIRIWNLDSINSHSNLADSIILSCNWIKFYLKNNLKLTQDERQICDNI